jgi:hypothetical protein
MPKSRRKHGSSEQVFELLRGGDLPNEAVQRQVARLKRQWAAEASSEATLRLQAAKYAGRIAPPLSRMDEQSKEAVAELGRITEQLAKRKLPAARKRRVLLPDTWGTYTLRFTPPYSGLGTYSVGTVSSVTGNPTIEAAGVDALGQLNCSVSTDFEKASGGTASNVMGVYFKPMFSQAKARVSFESDIAFSWYVNSIRNKPGFARAQGMIRLYQYDGAFVQPALHSGAFIGFNMSAENEIKFNAYSNAGPTWYLEAPVSSNHFYFVVISLECSANGAGWPGSLAGASARVTVPSITVTISGDPVLQSLSRQA